MKKKKKEDPKASKPEKLPVDQALERMKSFSERKEKMIAFIISSKN